jgi:hypothetical protein
MMESSSRGPGSISELLGQLRRGQAPRPMRFFAAQGLLPVSREDLIRVLLILAADPEEEIADLSQKTLDGFSVDNLLAVFNLPDVDPLEIELLARCRQDEGLWGEIARAPKCANETLRWLARVGPLSIQDIIVTNQVRLLSCLELLEDLRSNPQVSLEVLRRAREFEEEFLEKAIVWASSEGPKAPGFEGLSIEHILAELRAIGLRLPGGELESFKVLELEPGAPPEIRDAHARLALMNVAQRVIQALTGTREERLILVRDRSSMVIRAVISSPKMNELEVEQIAGMRACNEEALRMIAGKPRWLRRYGVLRALAFNPKTPPGIALQLVRRLSGRDMVIIGKDRGVSETVRRVAREHAERRR